MQIDTCRGQRSPAFISWWQNTCGVEIFMWVFIILMRVYITVAGCMCGYKGGGQTAGCSWSHAGQRESRRREGGNRSILQKEEMLRHWFTLGSPPHHLITAMGMWSRPWYFSGSTETTFPLQLCLLYMNHLPSVLWQPLNEERKKKNPGAQCLSLSLVLSLSLLLSDSVWVINNCGSGKHVKKWERKKIKTIFNNLFLLNLSPCFWHLRRIEMSGECRR